MASPVFGVTIARVKIEVDTSLSDADVETVMNTAENKAISMTGVTSAPSDAVKLENLREIVVLESCVEIRTKDPHSRAVGTAREEHYPQLIWMKRLGELYGMFLPHYTRGTKYQTDALKQRYNE